jgi:hypothetical protein
MSRPFLFLSALVPWLPTAAEEAIGAADDAIRDKFAEQEGRVGQGFTELDVRLDAVEAVTGVLQTPSHDLVQRTAIVPDGCHVLVIPSNAPAQLGEVYRGTSLVTIPPLGDGQVYVCVANQLAQQA